MIPLSEKAGVGARSPYTDALEIAHLLSERDADVLTSIGSGSDTYARKVARLFTCDVARRIYGRRRGKLVEQETGRTQESTTKKPTRVKFICVPTSLSANEWKMVVASTSAAGKKQHFGLDHGGAQELVLMDLRVVSTAP